MVCVSLSLSFRCEGNFGVWFGLSVWGLWGGLVELKYWIILRVDYGNGNKRVSLSLALLLLSN